VKPELKIREISELRNRVAVFRDRTHAGDVLADMLGSYRGSSTLVLAIPAGGVPVAAKVAERLELNLDVAVVSKVTLPWSTESGYGAVAFDGTVRLNDSLLPHLGLSTREIEEGVEKTRQKVHRRVQSLRGGRPLPGLTGRTVILVDDGLASGFTMLVAVEALRHGAAREVCVAVPTAHQRAADRLASSVEHLYCANLRGGRSFAVADAYEVWHDVSEDEAKRIIEAKRLQEN
jgi:predicted phosphoribosyltransferase